MKTFWTSIKTEPQRTTGKDNMEDKSKKDGTRLRKRNYNKMEKGKKKDSRTKSGRIKVDEKGQTDQNENTITKLNMIIKRSCRAQKNEMK